MSDTNKEILKAINKCREVISQKKFDLFLLLVLKRYTQARKRFMWENRWYTVEVSGAVNIKVYTMRNHALAWSGKVSHLTDIKMRYK